MILFLIGYMGAGKSTIGFNIADSIVNILKTYPKIKFFDVDIEKIKFIDSDTEISKIENMSITDIITQKGEDYFRDRETKFFENIEDEEGTLIIVATGGGSPIRNINIMNRKGSTVYIKVPVNTIYSRLNKSEIEKRPLLKGLTKKELYNKIKKDIKDREQYYNKAKYIINVYGKSVTWKANPNFKRSESELFGEA